MDFPDGSSVQLLVWAGRRSQASTAEYDTAQYDLDVYDGSTQLTWKEYQSQVMAVDIRRGKDAFLKRFRTGTAKIELDNATGQFTTGAFLPGDYVWIQVLRSTPAGPPPTPIPDGTQWQDMTGRIWTVNGDGAVLAGDPATVTTHSLFYGRVNYAEDIVRGGVDITRVRCTDLQADLALLDRPAQTAQGAGETTSERMQRIIGNAGQGFSVSQLWPTVATMQATTLAGQSLSEAQLTMDSEGGDMWLDTEPNFNNGGTVVYAGRDWLVEAPRSTSLQWNLGNTTGLPLTDGRLSKARQLIINEATFASVGGTAQTSSDAASIQRYGKQTTRRLDLICEGNTQPAFLATRAVNNLANPRPRVSQATTPVDTAEAAEYGYGVQFGDLTNVYIPSINGWAYAFLSHVVGIEHSWWHDEWNVTVTLDDAFVDNVDGAYSYLKFDDSYSLGGQP